MVWVLKRARKGCHFEYRLSLKKGLEKGREANEYSSSQFHQLDEPFKHGYPILGDVQYICVQLMVLTVRTESTRLAELFFFLTLESRKCES